MTCAPVRLKPPSSAALALGIYRPPLHGGWTSAQSSLLEPRRVPFLGICAQEIRASPRPHLSLAQARRGLSAPCTEPAATKTERGDVLSSNPRSAFGAVARQVVLSTHSCCFTGLELACAFRFIPQPAGLFLPLLGAPLPTDLYIRSHRRHAQKVFSGHSLVVVREAVTTPRPI